MATKLPKLSREDRLRLMRFVCSFVWADLEVKDKERAYVHKLVKRLHLEDDRAEIEKWLKVPPRPEEVDPAQVPREHRQIFLDAAREVIAADGHVDPEESENLRLLEALLR